MQISIVVGGCEKGCCSNSPKMENSANSASAKGLVDGDVALQPTFLLLSRCVGWSIDRWCYRSRDQKSSIPFGFSLPPIYRLRPEHLRSSGSGATSSKLSRWRLHRQAQNLIWTSIMSSPIASLRTVNPSLLGYLEVFRG